MGPGSALILFALGVLGLYFLLRPGRGWLPRVLRVLRLTERVRLEDTLKHLLHSESLATPATTESVAGAVEVSRGRALALLERLGHMGLAAFDRHGHRLTAPGRHYALRLVRAHRLLERYFADRTGLPPVEWHQEAERREHQLSPAQTEALAARMGHPVLDPHGDPIPGPAGELPPPAGVPLTETAPGNVVRIVHLEDEPLEIYDRLLARGLSLGAVLRVTRVEPAAVSFVLDGREEVLDSLLAANVEVAAAAGAVVSEQPQRTLADLRIGEQAEVLGIAPVCQGAQRRRLLDLGVVPGTTIRAIMASAAGDPIAYEIRGALIALRRGQAAWIRVRAAERGAAA